MNQSDILYRAIVELGRALEGERELSLLQNAIKETVETESVSVTKVHCCVETDWIEAIERGLEFIAKAIGEDRQFITQEGEVKPIEKVERISKESVRHLARHSDYITREQTGDEIIPDKLYTEERLSDYAVYENRFLYTLLCLIVDFVDIRFDGIERATTTYHGNMTVNKSVVSGKNKLTLGMNLAAERENDWYLHEQNPVADILARLGSIRRITEHFMQSPLITEASKKGRIKTKIVKTNVLRMDKNFKEAVALYEFLIAYEGDGYTLEFEEQSLGELSEQVAAEFALPAILYAYLTYEHGLGLEDYYQKLYEKENARREEEAEQLLLERIRNLKKRVAASGMGMEEYMLLLEERNAELEECAVRLKDAQAEIEQLHGQVDALTEENNNLKEEIERLNAEIAALNEQIELLNLQIEELRAEIESLNAEIEALNTTIDELKEEMRLAEENFQKQLAEAEEKLGEEKSAHAAALAEMTAKHAEEITELKSRHNEAVAQLEAKQTQRIQLMTEQHKAKVKALNESLESKEQERAETAAQLQLAERDRDVAVARFTAFRVEHGFAQNENFKEEDTFTALEHDYETLGKLVRTEWKGVKKMLRKEMFAEMKSVVFGKKTAKTEEAAIAEAEQPAAEESVAEEQELSTDD